MSDYKPAPVDGAEIERSLREAARERILVLDGAMGTQIQDLKLSEADFRGERFKGFNHDLKGNNDIIALTQPDALQKKVDAGATRAITQFFFDNDVYFRYLDKVRARGIEIPILPGIVPVQNFKQTAGFARRTGASVPQWLADRFEGLEDDAATRRLVAAAVCAEQVLDLIDRGVGDLHFYTMNKADLVYAICHLVGLKPEKPAAQAVAAE